MVEEEKYWREKACDRRNNNNNLVKYNSDLLKYQLNSKLANHIVSTKERHHN
jgi:hypothetical protein